MKIVDANVLLGPSDIDKFHNSLYNFNIQISENNESLNIELFDVMYEASKWKVSIKELETIDNTINKQTFRILSLYDDTSYESMVYIPSSIQLEHESIGTSPVFDKKNKIEYSLSEASIGFIFYLMYTLSNSNDLGQAELLHELRGRLKRNLMSTGSWNVSNIDKENIKKYKKEAAKETFVKDVEKCCSIYTLKINSEKKYDLSVFQNLASSFLFNVCYTLDEPIIELKSFDSILALRKSLREVKDNKVNPPHRLYNQELVYYYQMGISAETPALKFLFHYQVLEYFFKSVYDEYLISKVKKTITRPEFSYSDDNDIRDLIKIITENTKSKQPDVEYNELDALNLLLRKYILTDKIDIFSQNCDTTLIDYYSHQNVSFSGGSRVDFVKRENFHQNLAARIYKTRNSIVHSKDGERYKYIPYLHEKELNKELPLLKFVCQEIIIESADLLDLEKK